MAVLAAIGEFSSRHWEGPEDAGMSVRERTVFQLRVVEIRQADEQMVARRTRHPLRRNFVAPAPNRVQVADCIYAAAWSGVVYVAFAVDTFSRRIVGWSASTNKRTPLILSALDMGLWQRGRAGTPVQAGELIHHSDSGSTPASAWLPTWPRRTSPRASAPSGTPWTMP
jgi:transposase InsO family protein